MSDSGGTTQAAVSVGSAGTQIYDSIMGQIEPELVSTSAPGLDAKYANETKEQHAQRMAHYKQAFEMYDKCFDGFVLNVMDESKKAKLNARRAAEAESRAEDEQAESGILSQISSA